MPDKRAEDDDAVSQSPGTVSAERKDSYDLVSLSAGTRAEIMRKVSTVRVGKGSEHFCRCFDECRDVQRDTQSGELVTFNYVVMSLIGRGLFDLLSKAGDVFSPGTAIGVSLQLLDALKALHKVGYLHLDVKPENATIGRAETNERRRIFLINFGQARRYISQSDASGENDQRRTSAGHQCTHPSHAHARADYCRADDIESWFYTLVDMYTGKLPWTHVTSERHVSATTGRACTAEEMSANILLIGVVRFQLKSAP
ncbi:hypothetical protein niasHT_014670 [Heterodera trifolii]|uniref:Protein kinase domain-containing protein n=1 Tax=Heterodera trifolii TaxID=157864 RepID=A0ABD2LI38_9BILA